MAKVDLTSLIEAGAHFGHLTRRWNPKMRQYIFMEKNGIHIIDLKKTQLAIETAANKLREMTSEGATILFAGTKKQAKGVIAEEAKRCGMNWVSERWLGGMLTNFATIRKSINRMQKIEKMETDGTFEKLRKKEQLFKTREKEKLRKILEGVESMKRMPNAIFIVDIKKESIAINEALRLNIPIFAIVDTNCDPEPVNYVIPSNDDASRTIEVITKVMADAILEGSQKYQEVKAEKAAEKEKLRKQEKEDSDKKKVGKPKIRKVKFDDKGEQKIVSHDKQTPKKVIAKEEKTKEPKKEKVAVKKEEATIDDYLPCEDYKGAEGFHIFFREDRNEHYFAFNDKSGKTFLRSEGYTTEKAMKNGITSVTKNAHEEKRWTSGTALDDKYYYYAIKAGNGQEIGRSCYYKTKDEMEKDFDWIRSNDAQLIKDEEEKTEEKKK